MHLVISQAGPSTPRRARRGVREEDTVALLALINRAGTKEPANVPLLPTYQPQFEINESWTLVGPYTHH